MKKQGWIASLVVSGLMFGTGLTVCADGLDKQIEAAQVAVDEARIAIENGKMLVGQIPSDSPLMAEVVQMLKASSDNWAIAVDALDSAKLSAGKVDGAASDEIAQDYTLLAHVNASVALSGAKVVQTGLLFVDAAANNKTESLDIIRQAMKSSLAAAKQVQSNYERLKSIIVEKHSK